MGIEAIAGEGGNGRLKVKVEAGFQREIEGNFCGDFSEKKD